MPKRNVGIDFVDPQTIKRSRIIVEQVEKRDEDHHDDDNDESSSTMSSSATTTSSSSSRRPPKKLTTTFSADSLQQLLFVDMQSDQADTVYLSLRKLLTTSDSNNGSTTPAAALTIENGGRVEEFIALGGHSLLAVTMKKWQDDPFLQAMCCVCLGGFLQALDKKNSSSPPPTTAGTTTTTTTTTTAAIASSLERMGVLEMVFAALANHSDKSVSLPRHAITIAAALIRNLNHNVNATTTTAATLVGSKAMGQFVKNFNGIEVVLAAMQARPQSQSLQSAGCCLLKVFLESKLVANANDIMLAKGGLTIVSKALQDHWYDPQIKQDASFLIKSILDSM